MATPVDFAKALLNRLGLPQTQNRIVGLVDFAAREGGHWANGARFNPFNTTLGMPGAKDVIGAVKAYPNWTTGIEATARTMTQSNMAPLLNALKSDASPHVFLHAITQTPWCPQNIPGCQEYDVGDPMALYNGYANRQDNTSLDQGVGAGIVGWIKDHPLITAGAVMAVVGGGLYYFRPDLFRQIPVVGRLAAAENPVKALPAARSRRASRKPGAGGGRVQTLLFPRESFTPASAKAWAKSHGFRAGKTDVTDQYVRIRQLPPGGRMRTIQFQNTPVRAVVRFG